MKITSYIDAVKYLESFIGKVIFKVNKEFLKKHDPLERMRIFLSLLGNPQDKFKSVLVGGTSGKGSTAYLISHILETAGYKTGLTISPHLQKVNERLQINGQPISDSEFAKLTDSMIRIIEQMKKMRIGEPSYFEILIGMAFLYFVQKKVDIAVVEVGMGGEFDATNTLNPLIAVLTNVGLDHTNVLGKTVEQIARTKAGIIKGLRIKDKGLINNSSLITNHLTVVSGVKQSSVIKIIEERCKNVEVELRLLWRDFGYKIKNESSKGSVFDLTTSSGRGLQLNSLNLSLLGDYQVENASLAIEVALNLNKFGFEVKENEIRKALKTAFFPGRFEIVNIAPTFSSSENGLPRSINSHLSSFTSHLVLDGAHNPVKMKEFIASLKKLFPKERPTSPSLRQGFGRRARLRGARKVFIVGFKFDKDIPKMLKEILPIADKIILTEFNRSTDMNVHASAKTKNLKSLILNLKSNVKVTVEKDSKKALKIGIKTIQQYNNTAILVVTGSLYLVGEIRSLLK